MHLHYLKRCIIIEEFCLPFRTREKQKLPEICFPKLIVVMASKSWVVIVLAWAVHFVFIQGSPTLAVNRDNQIENPKKKRHGIQTVLR